MSSKALTAASSKPLILAILSHGESYGYQIIKNVTRLSGGTLDWTEAMLYPVLHRMERDGLIQSSWRRSGAGRRRKYYVLTKQGRAALAAERAAWLDVHRVLETLWYGQPNLAHD